MEEFATKDMYGEDVLWIVPVSADDVSDTLLEYAVDTVDAWFPEGKIDWEDVWDRMEGYDFPDGKKLSWGDEYDTPAMRKVQRYVRKVRSEG